MHEKRILVAKLRQTTMIIYSWNMLYLNRELDRALEFIRHSDFDIFCLQEVPEAFRKSLEALPYTSTYEIDTEKVSGSAVTPMYNVILSKVPVVAQGEISFADTWSNLPFRTRFFIFVMKPFHFSETRNRKGLYVDVDVQGIPVRLFNLHLALAHPGQRLVEFERAMAEQDMTRQTIVCGDFNILESFHIVILNWLLGGPVQDVIFHKKERTHIEKRFMEYSLINPLRGSITHPFSRSQLDHILVPNLFSITSASVVHDRHGSDHCPIRVEVQMKA